jgi:hypothetical protein
MYALKRIAAYAIDIAIFWLPMTLLVNFGEGPFEEDLTRRRGSAPRRPDRDPEKLAQISSRARPEESEMIRSSVNS